MSNQSIPEKHTIINPLKLAAGGLLASGTGFGAFAAACMDGGAGVDVIGVLVLSGLGLALAGCALLHAAQKIEEARADRELAEEIRDFEKVWGDRPIVDEMDEKGRVKK